MAEIRKKTCVPNPSNFCFYVLLHVTLYYPLTKSNRMDQSSDYGTGHSILVDIFQAEEHLSSFLPFTHLANELISVVH